MYICEMLHLMSGQVGRQTGEWPGEQADGLGPGMGRHASVGRHASAGRHASVGRWANVGRWASGLASECGQVSEWVGEQAGEQVWAGERSGEQAGRLGLGTGRWASVGRWASIGRWASGPASERGLVSKWVGGHRQVSGQANGQADWDRERAGGPAWADGPALAGGPVGRRASVGW